LAADTAGGIPWFGSEKKWNSNEGATDKIKYQAQGGNLEPMVNFRGLFGGNRGIKQGKIRDLRQTYLKQDSF